MVKHVMLNRDNSPRVAEFLAAVEAREGDDYAYLVCMLSSATMVTRNLMACGLDVAVVDHANDLLLDALSRLAECMKLTDKADRILADSVSMLRLMESDIKDLRKGGHHGKP